MKSSKILVLTCKFLYPFMLLFGFYVIIHGDLSPGGGFQGGTILATAYLAAYYVNPKQIKNLRGIINLEKFIFILILITATISVLTRGVFFSNFINLNGSIESKRIFLIIINLLIGLKVATGLIAIFSSFLKEGE